MKREGLHSNQMVVDKHWNELIRQFWQHLGNVIRASLPQHVNELHTQSLW
jgi:hypothetical protein